jgi:hypothetical protein
MMQSTDLLSKRHTLFPYPFGSATSNADQRNAFYFLTSAIAHAIRIGQRTFMPTRAGSAVQPGQLHQTINRKGGDGNPYGLFTGTRIIIKD